MIKLRSTPTGDASWYSLTDFINSIHTSTIRPFLNCVLNNAKWLALQGLIKTRFNYPDDDVNADPSEFPTVSEVAMWIVNTEPVLRIQLALPEDDVVVVDDDEEDDDLEDDEDEDSWDDEDDDWDDEDDWDDDDDDYDPRTKWLN